MANYQEYVTRIFLNSEQAENKIANLRSNIKGYQKDKQAALDLGGKEGDKAWRKAERDIRAAEKQIDQFSTTSQRVNAVLENLNTASVKDIQRTVKAINKELASGSIERGSEGWKALNEQLRRAKAELKTIQGESEAASNGGFISKTSDFLNRNWGALTQAWAGLTGLSQTVRQATQAYADMEEAMANVRKYTGQTAEEVHAMNEEFKQIDTRTSREQLNELAGAAGRLGITSHDEIMEFVDAADKINVALGDDLGDGAVDQIGKLAMAFGEDETLGLRGAMLATGSAINELAQNSAANAGYLVDFSARLSGIGKQAGLTQAQIMGLGSVMDENMQRDEMSSTALSNLIAKLATDSSKFAQIAGLDVKEFADLVQNDMNGALLTLFDTLNQKGGLMELAPLFSEMGLDGSRAVGVLTVLADKVNDVRKNQQIANDAYKEGTSVISEFDVQNSTVQAGLDKAKKRFNDLTVELGQKLMPVVKYTVTTGGTLVKLLSSLITFVGNHIVLLTSITATIVALNAAKLYNITLSKLQVVWNGRIATSIKGITKAIRNNPIGLLVTLFTSLIAVMIESAAKMKKNREELTALGRANKQAAQEFEDESTKVKTLTKLVHNNSLSYEFRKQKLDELKQIVPDYLADLDKEKGLINDNTDALTNYLTQLEKQIKLKAAQEELENAYKEKRKLEKQKEQQQKDVDDAQETLNGARFAANARSQKLGTKGAQQLSTGLDQATKQAESKLSTAQRKLNETNEKLKSTTKDINDLNNEILNSSSDLAKQGLSGGNGGGGGGNTTTTSTSDGSDPKENQYAKELAAAKKQYERETALETDKYNRGLEREDEYEKNMAAMKQKSYDEQLKIMEKYGKKETDDYKDLEVEKQTAETEGNNKARDLTLEQLERRYQSEQALLKAQLYDNTSEIYGNEEALNQALFKLDMKYLTEKQSHYLQTSDEWAEIEAQKEQKLNDDKLAKAKAYEEAKAKLMREYVTQNGDEQEAAELAMLEEMYKNEEITYEQHLQAMMLIREKYAKHTPTADEQTKQTASASLSAAEKSVGDKPQYDTSGADMGVSSFAGIFQIVKYRQEVNEQLKQLYGDDYKNSEEYNEAKKQNNQAMLGEIVSAAQAAYSGISQIMSAASAYSQACSDYETAKITADYEKQIDAAGNNSKKKERLEKERDKKIAAAKTKANKKAMKIEVAQAVASTAMAAINAYASASKISWVLGPIAAAMATAAGMLQIATIKKQHQAEEAGYYEGGFTSGRNYRRRAGVVHEGEFVANHNAVNNRSILPALQLIDQAQRNNTVSSLTAEDVSRAVGAGGSAAVVAPVVNVQTDNEQLNRAIGDVAAVVDSLNAILAGGIHANVSIDGTDGLDAQYRRYKRLKGL